MECKSAISVQAPIRIVNLSLSPENFYRRSSPSPQLPYINSRNQSQIKSSKICSSPVNTYAIGYMGDESGELRFSFKRSSIPKIPHSEINRKSRKISPSINIQKSYEYSIHKYFRPKPLTPASLKIFTSNEYRNKLSPVLNFRNL